MTATALPAAPTSRLLPRVLAVNGAATAASGLVALLGAGLLDGPLGVATPLLVVVGAGFLAYAALLLRWSRRDPVAPAAAWSAIVGDAAYVAASVAIAAAPPAGLTTLGRWTVALLALAVADLAVLQYVGLRRQQAG